MPREVVSIRDWPQGPWRFPSGRHIRPNIARFEEQVSEALQTLYDFPRETGVTELQIQQNQHALNIWEGQIQYFPQEWGHAFRRHRNHGETLLDSWIRAQGGQVELPIGAPVDDVVGVTRDGFGNWVQGAPVGVFVDDDYWRVLQGEDRHSRLEQQGRDDPRFGKQGALGQETAFGVSTGGFLQQPPPDWRVEFQQHPLQSVREQEQERQKQAETMNRHFGIQPGRNHQGMARRQSNAPPPQWAGPQQRQPNDLTYAPGENPFPPGSHRLTKAVRLLDTSDMPIHIFFILDRNTHPSATEMRRHAVATAKKRREQVGGDLFAVATAALTSNNPKLVKVCDTAKGELFATAGGREDLAVVMFEVDREVWRLAGVGTSISEGRLYLLRNGEEKNG